MYRKLALFGWIVILCWTFFLPLLYGGVALANHHTLTFDELIVVGCAVTVAMYIVFATWRWSQVSWLRVTATDITYHTPGITIRSEWANIAELQSSYGQVTLILTRRSATAMSLGIIMLRFYLFTAWTPASPLYQAINDRAPHLLATNQMPPRR